MRPLLLLLLAALAGCSLFRSDDPVACTLEFRSYTVRVVNEAGGPVNGLDATVRNTRTGEIFTFADEPFPADDGHYLVATDAQFGALSEAGDTVAFHAEGQGLTADASFVFAGGPCHVEKRSGPDEIVAEAP